MERILVLLFALFSLNAFAASPAGVPIKNIGGQTTNSLGAVTTAVSDNSYFTLTAGVASATAGHFYVFTKAGSSNPYQVTNGNTAHCDSIDYVTAAAGNSFQLVASLTSWAQNATTITSGIYQSGAITIPGFVSLAEPNPTVAGIGYTFASLTYPGIEAQATGIFVVHILCRETTP